MHMNLSKSMIILYQAPLKKSIHRSFTTIRAFSESCLEKEKNNKCTLKNGM